MRVRSSRCRCSHDRSPDGGRGIDCVFPRSFLNALEMDGHANLEMLRYAGRRLYGDRWRSAIAADLGVTARTIRRWSSSSDACPTDIGDRLIEVMDRKRKMMADAQEELRHRQLKLEPSDSWWIIRGRVIERPPGSAAQAGEGA